MVRIAGQHIGLGIGEMPRGQPPRPVGVAGLDHLGQPNVSVQHGTPLAENPAIASILSMVDLAAEDFRRRETLKDATAR